MTNLPLERLMVFTGNANARLAQDVVKHLNIGLGRAIVGRFSDGEVMIELLENVRGVITSYSIHYTKLYDGSTSDKSSLKYGTWRSNF